jgi:hypothetical protein
MEMKEENVENLLSGKTTICPICICFDKAIREAVNFTRYSHYIKKERGYVERGYKQRN